MAGKYFKNAPAAARMNAYLAGSRGALAQIGRAHKVALGKIGGAVNALSLGDGGEKALASAAGKALLQAAGEQAAFIAAAQMRAVEKRLLDVAQDAYRRNMYDIQHQTGLGFEYVPLSQEAAREVASAAIGGQSYEDRIRKNGQVLSGELKQELEKALLAGKSQAQVKQAVEEKLGMSFRAARRLLNTETCRVVNAAQLKSMQEAGIGRYTFVAVLDKNTSKVCSGLDGKVIDVAAAVPGKTLPPLHPHCRSTIVPYVEGDGLDQLEQMFVGSKTGGMDSAPEGMEYENSRQWREADEQIGMMRKTGNSGVFAHLAIPMTKKHVRAIANEMGINLKGITLLIDPNEELIGRGYYGRAEPEKIGGVRLFPDAFTDREQLTRTLYHEIIHVQQFREFGTIMVMENRNHFEELAYEAEERFAESLKKRRLLK